MASTDPRPELGVLESIQRRVLWLATLAVHHANTRPNPDGTKVGGHQASSSSAVSLMTALYFSALRAGDVGDHWGAHPGGRFIAMVGDAELDEGNVWESLLEEHVAGLGNLLWIVDMNRQSLDRVTPDGRRRQIADWFGAAGWRVIELRWGRRLQALFAKRGGERLRSRLETMANAEYQALLRRPAGMVRKALVTAPDGHVDGALDRVVGHLSDDALAADVADVGGHDLSLILDALDLAGHERDRPCVILAQTIKGWGLPLAGDPMNHGALLTAAQMGALRESLGVAAGREWEAFPDSSPEARWISGRPAPFSKPPLHLAEPVVP